MSRYNIGVSPDFSSLCESREAAFKIEWSVVVKVSNSSKGIRPVKESAKDNVIFKPGVVDLR